MFTRSVSPEAAPDKPTYIEIGFENGDPVSLNGAALSPATILAELNKVAGDNGVGRVDIVESRFVGMKSRGVYETPGGTVLLAARRGIESICLDRGEVSKSFCIFLIIFSLFDFKTFLKDSKKNAHFSFSVSLSLSLPPPKKKNNNNNNRPTSRTS